MVPYGQQCRTILEVSLELGDLELGCLIACVHCVPVDQLLNEGCQVVWATVLHVKVVGVLPDVSCENGALSVNKGVDCVWGLADAELAGLVGVEPCPARAELGCTSSLELGLEVVERSKVAGDGVGDLAGWHTATVGLHALPVEGVVPDLASVVEGWGGGSTIPAADNNLLKCLGVKIAVGNLQGGVGG